MNWLWEPEARRGALPCASKAVIVEFWTSTVRRLAPGARASQNLRSPATQPEAHSRGASAWACVWTTQALCSRGYATAAGRAEPAAAARSRRSKSRRLPSPKPAKTTRGDASRGLRDVTQASVPVATAAASASAPRSQRRSVGPWPPA